MKQTHKGNKALIENSSLQGLTVNKYSLYFLIIIFTVGIFGHLFSLTKPLMIFLTPYTLFICGSVVLYNYYLELKLGSAQQKNWRKREAVWFIFVYLITLTLEIVGVHTSLVFGSYRYTDVLGIQILDTPLVIGLNWTLIILGIIILLNNITIKAEQIAGQQINTSPEATSPLIKNKYILAFTVGIIAVTFDYFLEPVAIALDYWQWQNIVPPLHNFIAWFIISFFASLSYSYLKLNLRTMIAGYYFIIQFVFF